MPRSLLGWARDPHLPPRGWPSRAETPRLELDHSNDFIFREINRCRALRGLLSVVSSLAAPEVPRPGLCRALVFAEWEMVNSYGRSLT